MRKFVFLISVHKKLELTMVAIHQSDLHVSLMLLSCWRIIVIQVV